MLADRLATGVPRTSALELIAGETAVVLGVRSDDLLAIAGVPLPGQLYNVFERSSTRGSHRRATSPDAPTPCAPHAPANHHAQAESLRRDRLRRKPLYPSRPRDRSLANRNGGRAAGAPSADTPRSLRGLPRRFRNASTGARDRRAPPSHRSTAADACRGSGAPVARTPGRLSPIGLRDRLPRPPRTSLQAAAVSGPSRRRSLRRCASAQRQSAGAPTASPQCSSWSSVLTTGRGWKHQGRRRLRRHGTDFRLPARR
jgi:hypothetical protein